MAREQTYWVDDQQVTKADYVKAERDAGFRNTLGQPDEPATAAWWGTGSDGQRHHGSLDPMAGHTPQPAASP